MATRDLLRLALIVMETGMLLMAAFYLRRRQLAWLDALAWMVLAMVVPVLGPFLVFVFRPGEPRVAQTAAGEPLRGGRSRRLRVDDPPMM